MTCADNGTAVSSAPARPRRLRPRDAASIMLLDRSGDGVRVLVGKRSSAHVFMPDLYVFPGGRRDAADHRLACACDMKPVVYDRMKTVAGNKATDSRLRALALAGLRELHEETGVAVGVLQESGNMPLPFLPDLANLRYMARAITPPGYPRRFDTHFFALFADEARIDPRDVRDSQELQDVRWIDVSEPTGVNLPDITAMILNDLRESLNGDPSLPFGVPVPFYHTRHGRPIRDLL